MMNSTVLKQFKLSANWQFRQYESANDTIDSTLTEPAWMPASVPGSVHQDLMRAERIPDPFVGLNENHVQWVGETDWLYRCMFDVSTEMLDAPHLDLCFDGLDTFATVWLNGEKILTTDNMFVPTRIGIKERLKTSGNVLAIHFASALLRGKALEAHNGTHKLWNGDSSRLYVRKAQYHYGWDWGPTLLTAGIWRPVRIEAYATRIMEVHAPAEVSANLQQAVIPVHVMLTDPLAGAQLDIRLVNVTGETVVDVSLPANEPNVRYEAIVSNPELWYPHGYGEQPRYRLSVTLHAGELVLDSREILIGLRRLRLVQEPLADEPGSSFYFEVNNIPLFCGGANWIPADSFTPRITAEQYRAWLQLAADANMLMLRVWGGGIYEEDIFYELCDEFGLLVWQDFMFACGMYPAHNEFLMSVRAEAEANVKRLRHHPCIALWCGNNEDYQLADSIHAYDSTFEGDFSQTAFPAREIYERLLPEICNVLDPNRPYWPGSSYGGRSVSDQTIGDRHSWDVWHGIMAAYQDYPLFAGRFVSEFGMQAAPAMTTIRAFAAPDDGEIQGPVMRHHNKADDGPERLDHYLHVNGLHPTTLEDYVYTTQFVQSEALVTAIEGWRRRWSGINHYATAGALIWQLNDCWPVTSWAIADYYLNPKPAYYRVRQALAPVALGITPKAGGVSIWMTNSTRETFEATLEIRLIDFAGVCRMEQTIPITAIALQSTELGAYLDHLNNDVVVAVRLIYNGAVIARRTYWPEPSQRLLYPDPGLQLTRRSETTFGVNVLRPARAVHLLARGRVKWSDNMLDLLPGDEQIIQAEELLGDSIGFMARWFGSSSPLDIWAQK